MDLFLSGSEGVTGLCRWQLRRARSQFLFQSTKISSQEHWLQSFGKANWIVLYFSDSSSLGAPKAGALPETHHNFGGRRSVGAVSCPPAPPRETSARRIFPRTESRGTRRSFRISACQHFRSAPLRALCLRERPTPRACTVGTTMPSLPSCQKNLFGLIRVFREIGASKKTNLAFASWYGFPVYRWLFLL